VCGAQPSAHNVGRKSKRMKSRFLTMLLAAASLAGCATPSRPYIATQSAEIVAASPANGDRTELPVSAIDFTFSQPVKLESLRISGPRGEDSLEQILVADGQAVPITASYKYPLKLPISAIGRYWIDLMAWEEATKTSISISYAFAIGTNEQLSAYDEVTAKYNEAEEKKAADKASSATE
jgi:hypothetical protein